MQHLLILGLGYTASHWLQCFDHHHFQITATTSQQQTKKDWGSGAITLLNHDDPKLAEYIAGANALLISAPPNEAGIDPFFEQVKQYIQTKHIRWIGYLSSTSVYGDHQGQWVNENSPSQYPSPLGERRLKAEAQWLSMKDTWPIHIFRLAGIYGPKRNALERLINGKKTSIYKANHVFSRIHVSDITQVLSASLNHPASSEIYNVADDLPCASDIVDDFAADLLQLPHTKKIDWSKAKPSPMLQQFYQCSRRICNNTIKQKLKIKLTYPSYKEGLIELLNHIKNQ